MTFKTIAVIAFFILLFLMFLRAGVTTEDLGLYLYSGFLFEIVPTIFSGIVITAIHYIAFSPNIGLRTDTAFINAMYYGELFINGFFSILPMIGAALMLGKSAGIGFISTTALSYYTYWLVMQ